MIDLVKTRSMMEFRGRGPYGAPDGPSAVFTTHSRGAPSDASVRVYELFMPWEVYEDMGSPAQVTITVEPGVVEPELPA